MYLKFIQPTHKVRILIGTKNAEDDDFIWFCLTLSID